MRTNSIEKLTEELVGIIRASKESNVFFVFAHKYFGKTELIENLQNSLIDNNSSIIINYGKEFDFCIDICKDNTIRYCYYGAIYYLLKTNGQKAKQTLYSCIKQFNSTRLMDSLILYKVLSTIEKRIKKNETETAYYLLFKCLSDLSTHQLREIIKALNTERNSFNFLLNLYIFNQSDINELCIIGDSLITNFVFTLRPVKSAIENINCLENNSKCNISIKYLIPYKPKSKNGFDISTPRVFKLFKKVGFNDKEASEEEIYNVITSDPYFANIEITKLNKREQYLIFSLIIVGGAIGKPQISLINDIIEDSKYNEILSEELDNNYDLWNIKGKYKVVDSWKEFLLCKKYIKVFKSELENFFCYILSNLLIGKLNSERFIALKNPNYKFWLNWRLSNYYHRLVENCIKIPDYKKKNSRMSIYHRRQVSEIFINSDLTLISKEICKSVLILFEDTLRFNLLINQLEIIEKNINDIKFEEIEEFLATSYHYADKWNDITIIKNIFDICDNLYVKNKIFATNVYDIIDPFKYKKFQNNFSNKFIVNYLFKNDYKIAEAIKNFIKKKETSTDMPMKRFKIAFSFPGEVRHLVEPLAKKLAAIYSEDDILYDSFHTAEFARPGLDVYLQKLYHDESELIVVVLCKEYDSKLWCGGIEWRAIRDIMYDRPDNIMFLKVNDFDVKGIYRFDGYIDITKHTEDENIEFIISRYNSL